MGQNFKSLAPNRKMNCYIYVVPQSSQNANMHITIRFGLTEM